MFPLVILNIFLIQGVKRDVSLRAANREEIRAPCMLLEIRLLFSNEGIYSKAVLICCYNVIILFAKLELNDSDVEVVASRLELVEPPVQRADHQGDLSRALLGAVFHTPGATHRGASSCSHPAEFSTTLLSFS